MELDSTEAIISGVEAGLGVGFVSRIAIGKAVRLGTLRPIAVEGLRIRRDFSFVRLPGADLEGASAAFRRFALAALSHPLVESTR
jgi:LysR family transcriptional regulator, transcriptional activator of the cysJI operon